MLKKGKWLSSAADSNSTNLSSKVFRRHLINTLSDTLYEPFIDSAHVPVSKHSMAESAQLLTKAKKTCEVKTEMSHNFFFFLFFFLCQCQIRSSSVNVLLIVLRELR